MTINGFQLPLTEVPTLAWPVEEPERPTIRSRVGAARRRRRRADVEAEDCAPEPAGEHHDGAMSRASGWFFMTPPG